MLNLLPSSLFVNLSVYVFLNSQAHPKDCVCEEAKDASHPLSPEETVYANTQSPTMQSDGPTYSTVNFHKNQEAAMTDITLSQRQDTCEYAAVKHPTK